MKYIRIKTNLLTILIVGAVLLALCVLLVTNGIQNLFFKCLSPEQVSSVTVHAQFDDRCAQLSEDDQQALILLLQKVSLQGRSVRLYAGESMNPHYTVQLKTGISFAIACEVNYYILNGRGYLSPEGAEENCEAIGRLYLEHIGNRSYFPREAEDGR